MPAGAVSRRARLLRSLAIFVAFILGVIAVWLVVTGDPKQTKVGVLVGLWGLLIAAYPMLGTRHQQPVADSEAAPGAPSTALEARSVVQERRAYEERLEAALRRQVHASVAAEMSSLKDEISALRSELVEKVGGQLRLERIETTRLIGSDLEAMKNEVRQLADRPGASRQSTIEAMASAGRAAIRVERPVPAEADHLSSVVEQTATAREGASTLGATPPGAISPGATTPGASRPSASRPTASRPTASDTPSGQGRTGPAAPATRPRPEMQPAADRISPTPAPTAATPAPTLYTPTGPAPTRPTQPPAWQAMPARTVSTVTPYPVPRQTPAPQPATPPAQSRPMPADPFAGLPRLTPFREPGLMTDTADLGPGLGRTEPRATGTGPQVDRGVPAAPARQGAQSDGRSDGQIERRPDGSTTQPTMSQPSTPQPTDPTSAPTTQPTVHPSRHARTEPEADQSRPSGRRHRADGGSNLLSTILERERAESD